MVVAIRDRAPGQQECDEAVFHLTNRVMHEVRGIVV